MKWERFPFKVEKQFRLRGWDYSQGGYYFITICTKDRVNYFGEIENGKINYSKIGLIAKKYLLEIPKHYKNVAVDSFSIMPNHIHILLGNDVIGRGNIPQCRNMPTGRNMPAGRNMPWHVPTNKGNIPIINVNRFSKPIKNSISMVINHYKSAVTREVNLLDEKFKWQTRFNDEIIRDERHYWAVKKYIENNLANWGKDKERIVV